MKTLDGTMQNFLDGRLWHREQTPFSVEIIQREISDGKITVIPGIVKRRSRFGRGEYICNRCLNEDQTRFTIFICEKCQGPCAYCRVCLRMGRVSSCTELLMWTGPPVLFSRQHENHWQGQLTELQQQASSELIESNEKGRSHLIYAVCGAGKTEILFEPIDRLLKEGKRICVAAPRVDVILELEPRFKQAFPKTAITALYGGVKPTKEPAQLILATTHQLYRFHEAFDVIFVDEADAFPYTADETLRKAVEKAAKKEAPIHFVTATPSRKMIQEATRKQAISTIARRFHGFPLPVPKTESLWRYNTQLKSGKVPLKLMRWLTKQLADEKPFLLFFPTIELMETTLPLIQKMDPRIRAVHAEDEERKEKVIALRRKQLPGLLTTTILERGITIPNVQVAVIGAEQSIFTESALIQIGGRVGRSIDAPDGDFILFHHGMTYAMDGAKKEISALNKKGRVK